MPSTITHAVFSLDVLKRLKFYNERIYCLDEYLKTFAQGPDPLNFYNLDIPLSNNTIRKKYPDIYMYY